MMAELKSEFKKLFSVRTTYFLMAFVLALVVLVAFFPEGVHISSVDLKNPMELSSDITGTIGAIAEFSALVAILLVTNEYRYNTIMYTLTSSNRRSKVLWAKIIAATVFSIGFTIFFGALSPLLSVLGIHAHGGFHLVHQTFDWGSLLWHCLFYCWGYTMAGVIIGLLIRNQVGGVLTILIAPFIVESLLSLLLKKNTVDLPFTALHQVIGQGANFVTNVSPLRGAVTFSCYLVVSLAISWYLFLHRDAN
jgi:ABC-type transport system involved in multi-copper enzyme maturation permease subunit